MADLFEDEHFPAVLGSVYYDDRVDPGIEWKRPGEICDNPIFIDDGAPKHDIAQGHLSDCWLLSAAAVLATNSELFSEIIPQGQNFGEGYNGRFRFRFWRYGSWEEVDIDDRLPTKDGQLYFCHNRGTPNEFWSALMEKAYAKVHRSYQALNNGHSQDALVDMTGGIGEFIDLHGAIGVRVCEDEEEKANNITKLFKRLKRLDKKNSTFMCTAISVPEDGSFESTLDTGLVTGHAYSICKVLELTIEDASVRVIKLRNPWGFREWSGPWCDGSAEWEQLSDEQRTELGPVVADEGEFWMPFVDWINNFDMLNLCHLTPDSVHGSYGESVWNASAFHGIWATGATAGGCYLNPNTFWQNPQYYVKLQDPDEDEDDKCTLVISLMQKYSRAKKTAERTDDTEVAIGFDIFKYNGDDPEELEGFEADHTALQIKYPMYDFEFFRERSRRFELCPGTYCIIPSTYEPDTEAQFLLRLAFERPADSGEVDTPSGSSEATTEDTVREFDRLFDDNIGEDQVIDHRELRQILNEGIKRGHDEEFSRETCRALVMSVVGDNRGTLTKGQCKAIWRKVKELQASFDVFDEDNSGVMDIRELRRAIRAAGYRMSKQTLASVAQRYCGKSNQLNIDDYYLIAIKITTTSDAFDEVRRRSGSGNKVPLTVDQVLQMTL